MGAAITVLAMLAAQSAPASPAVIHHRLGQVGLVDQDLGAIGEPSTVLPLSHQLLLATYAWDIVGGRLSLRRGLDQVLLDDSLTADRLGEILGASPRAAELARDAHRELQWGYALKYAGLLGALAGAVGVTIGAAQANTDGNTQLAWSTAGGTLLLVGVVSTVLGVVEINNGFARALEAVGVYNLDLVRGR